MKGLLLKDFYMIKKYCRAFVFLIIVFLGVSCIGGENAFFAVYPVLLASVIPVTLISYDEKERWNLYCAALPYSRGAIVSAKYLVGLLSGIAMLILSVGVQVAQMIYHGTFTWTNFGGILSSFIVIALIGPTILLPVIFRYGVEKGRIVYYIINGVICALAVFGSEIVGTLHTSNMSFLSSGIVILLFAASWLLSIAFYKKKEL